MKNPVFEIIEQNSAGEMQKTYRIWADGTTEGFSENSAIINGIGPLLDYASGLLIQSVCYGRVVTEQELSYFNT